VRFYEAKPPSKDDAGEVAQRVRDRGVRWLRRHGHLDERAAEDRGNEAAEPSAIEGCDHAASSWAPAFPIEIVRLFRGKPGSPFGRYVHPAGWGDWA